MQLQYMMGRQALPDRPLLLLELVHSFVHMGHKLVPGQMPAQFVAQRKLRFVPFVVLERKRLLAAAAQVDNKVVQLVAWLAMAEAGLRLLQMLLLIKLCLF